MSIFTCRFLLVCCIVCMSLLAAAQPDWSGKVYTVGKIYPGFYVTNTNDTINGYFYHGDQTGNQKKCFFYKKETDPKHSSEFRPEEIRSYKVADKLYRSIPYSGGLLAKPLRFNLVNKDGAITEYVFYHEDGSGGSDPVFHKPHDAANSKPMSIQDFGLGFAKKVSQYVGDYPELSQKVANKDKGYGMLKILEIFAEYNQWYASKNK
jgi:hypothetical protein